MGDRYYNSNRQNSFTAQSYGYGQSQQPLSSLFDMGSAQGSCFSVNTRTPAYNTDSSYNQRPQLNNNYNNSNFQRTRLTLDEETKYRNTQQYSNTRLLPSYDESQNDILLSRSNTNFNTQSTAYSSTKYSPAWSFAKDLGEEIQSHDSSFSNLFDIPGRKEPPQNSSNWSNDNYNSSQNYQREPQQPSTLSFDYGGRSDNNYETLGRPNNEFKQNYNRGSGIQNQRQNYNKEYNTQNRNRGRGGGGFRGQRNRQNSGRGDRGKGDGGEEGGRCWKRRDEIVDQTETYQYRINSNTEGVKPISEDYDGDRNEGENDGYMEEEGNEGDGNDDGEWEKGDVFRPDQTLREKYLYYPPSPEEMGKMFKDLVIYFFFKVPKNRKEENPFVVICESFRKSCGYANLHVEDGFDLTCKDRKFCTLKYEGMMMVRGVGENSNLKEPRVTAGVELINNLAMSCYTLKAKTEYFSVKAFEEQQARGDVPGVYRLVPQSAVNDFDTAINYLTQISSDQESDEEHMINLPSKLAMKFKGAARKRGFEVRMIFKNQWVGVSRYRTTQYWRDKILASGRMENARFVLTPPQGIGNLLIPNFNVKEVVAGLRHNFVVNSTLQNVYGPPGVGPNIRKALPPWEKPHGNLRTKNNKKKMKRIIEEVKQGVPLQQTRSFKYLSKRRKKVLKNKLGQGF